MYTINIILFIGGVLYIQYMQYVHYYIGYCISKLTKKYNVEQLNTNQKLKYPQTLPSPSPLTPKKKSKQKKKQYNVSNRKDKD